MSEGGTATTEGLVVVLAGIEDTPAAFVGRNCLSHHSSALVEFQESAHNGQNEHIEGTVMKTLSAKEAKQGFGEMLDTARREPVTIEKRGRPVAVLVSHEDYAKLKEHAEAQEAEAWIDEALSNPKKLAWLRAEIQKGLDDIQAGRVREIDDSQSFADNIKKRGRDRLATKPTS